MQSEVIRDKNTGKGYKVTRFSAEYAKRNGHGRYYVALFTPGAHTAFDGWHTDKLKHAIGDGKAYIQR